MVDGPGWRAGPGRLRSVVERRGSNLARKRASARADSSVPVFWGSSFKILARAFVSVLKIGLLSDYDELSRVGAM